MGSRRNQRRGAENLISQLFFLSPFAFILSFLPLNLNVEKDFKDHLSQLSIGTFVVRLPPLTLPPNYTFIFSWETLPLLVWAGW